MAGTETYIIEANYDPTEITLDEWIQLYEKESTEKGGRKNTTWGNTLRKNSIVRPFLNQPVMNIFARGVESKNLSLLTDIQNAAGEGRTAQAKIQSNFRTIEKNVFPRLETIAKRTGKDVGSFFKLTKEVKALPTSGDKMTVEKTFVVSKVGELIENLQDHVRKFPEDKPIANAILFNIETGSRPSLTTEIRTIHFEPNAFDDAAKAAGFIGRDGLLIPAGTKGAKRQAKGQRKNVQPYNAPLSRRALTILQDQSEYNSKFIGDDKKLDHYFQILDKNGNPRPLKLEEDINRVLKEVTPFGIIRQITSDKGSKSSNEPLTSKMLRNLFINMGALTIGEESTAMLTNRDVAQNTGVQKTYLGTPGQYNDGAINDLDTVSERFWKIFTLRNPEAKTVLEKENKIRNVNEFIFGKNEIDPVTNSYKKDVVTYIEPTQVIAKNIPIQQTGFQPPVEDEASPQKMEQQKIADPETPKRITTPEQLPDNPTFKFRDKPTNLKFEQQSTELFGDIRVGDSGEAILDDSGESINLPNKNLPTVAKVAAAMFASGDVNKEDIVGVAEDVAKDTLAETIGAAGAKVLGFGKTAASRIGGGFAGAIYPPMPAMDQTLFGDDFSKLSEQEREQMGIKDISTTNQGEDYAGR